jgi:high frequency lysogenization protein
VSYSLTDRTIAIAGVYQAATLVQQIANTGALNEKSFEASIKSIFYIDADKPIDVFENIENIDTGLNTLIAQLGGNTPQITVQKDMSVTKYAIGAIILEKKLSKNQNMLKEISMGIDRAKNQAEHYTVTHENIIANLADIYSKTISTLQPRIMVQGEHIYISNPGQANKIRALLLAAIRAVVLWRQCGGTRWQLILQRKDIINTASMLLGKAKDTN